MMATKEEISMTGFAIVAYAGDARTALIQAMDKASEGKISEARKLVMDVTFIMCHGQDTLMTTMLLKDQMKTIIDLYERVNKLEGNPLE